MTKSYVKEVTVKRQSLSSAKQVLLTKWIGGNAKRKPIPKRVAGGITPLSFGQERLWFLEQMVPGSSVYNMHDAVRLQGSIDAQMLETVFRKLIGRHEALRTSFLVIDGSPVQSIAPAIDLELPIEDLRGIRPELREARAREIAAEETIRPFDLERGPLFRTRLIRIDDQDHILMWTMHHMISDGWSLGIIIKEVMALCEAVARDLPDPLPPLAIQYGDYALWQREWLTGPVLKQQLDFWRGQLEEQIPPLNLHVGPRPAFPTYSGRRRMTTYSLGLTESLKRLALSEGATLFMVLLGAFDVLLHRYSGLERICVGIPVANRNRSELEDVIGFFANTLPICADLKGEDTFLDLLAQIRHRLHAAYDHQDIPFERLVEELRPKREVNRAPFFQVMFVLQNEPMPNIEQPDLKISPFELHNATSKFDILMNVFETADGISLAIEYSEELFDADTIDGMMQHYRNLLESIVADPIQTVGKLPMLGEEETIQILKGWNDTEVTYKEGGLLLHELVEAQVLRSPNACALTFGSQSLTYRELNDRADQLAQNLMHFACAPESLIAICMERSAELAVGLLAVLKAGCAYLPLDPEYPPERLQYMLEDSGASILLFDGLLPEWAASLKIMALDIHQVLQTVSDNIEPGTRVKLSQESLAYVIYTSGSTGRPKGAMNTHRGIVNRLLWMQERYQLTERDRVLQKTPIGFDVSVWEVFWPLTIGATLVMGPQGIHRDSSWLCRFICEERITVLHFVPSMLRIFLLDSAARSCRSLTTVICSGEALPFDLQAQFRSQFAAELHNLYGPTEAAVDVTSWDCSEKIDRAIVPIGRPIANTQIYILDKHRAPVPAGVPGEIYIGGVGVGRGYLNRDDLTRERFLPDPFSVRQAARLYKTGDRARFSRGGVIEFLGRIDNQIKLRGFRIELGEIEQTLACLPGVEEAVVLLREDIPGDQKLVAYLVTSEEDGPGNQSLVDREKGVSEWKLVFDDAYALPDSRGDQLSEFAGWQSSYTGEPFSQLEMQEWVNTSVERIREKKPRNVLEVGCGTGLLLLRLAPECDAYVGIDISAGVLAKLEGKLAGAGIDPARVKLVQGSAMDLQEFRAESFDMIILNSVVQYFPSVEYLIIFLKLALPLLKPGGSIFLGDIRNCLLNEAFAASVEVERGGKDLTVSELRERMALHLAQDRELGLAPQLFQHLEREIPGIQHTEVLLRRGWIETEMCRYRYDAFLYKEGSSVERHAVDIVSHVNLPISLSETLADGLSAPLMVTGIPNGRLWRDVQLARFVKEEQLAIAAVGLAANSSDCGVVDPEALIDLWGDKYITSLSWSPRTDSGAFDALFVPLGWQSATGKRLLMPSSPVPPREGSWERLGSEPGRKRKESQISTSIKESLHKTLPDHMIPAAYVFLDCLPLSPNGKMDRDALPAPLWEQVSSEADLTEPRSDSERRLAEIWRELLGVRRIGVKSNYFDLGGHSLLAARLVFRLREEFKREIPLRVLFENPTLESMAAKVESYAPSKTEQANLIFPEMLKDSFLPASIRVSSSRKEPVSVRNILLTGATGFLGAFLLRDLLRHTSADILCLVRATGSEAGFQRLIAVLDKYGLAEDAELSRIKIIPGDLAKSNLGLSLEAFHQLSNQVDEIYHCGAAVNFMAPYSELRAANIGGTVEIFRLAALNRAKPVQFVSSIYTLVEKDLTAEKFEEHNVPRHGEDLTMGYLQTKWVAERLAEAARDRGIPVNIFRPGRISGDSLTGVCQSDDFYWSFLGACIKLGSAPIPYPDENLIPVDYASEAIVKLAHERTHANQTYHLVNARILAGQSLLSSAREYGFQLRALPYVQWRDEVLERIRLAPHNSSSRLAGLLFNGDGPEVEMEHGFGAPLTSQRLEQLGMSCPVIEDSLLHKYLDFFVANGDFPEPNRPTSNVKNHEQLTCLPSQITKVAAHA